MCGITKSRSAGTYPSIAARRDSRFGTVSDGTNQQGLTGLSWLSHLLPSICEGFRAGHGPVARVAALRAPHAGQVKRA